VLVQAATVARWHREGFRGCWRRRSRRRPGRPRIDLQLRQLIERMATENCLWGAPRIHGELLKLGIVVSERTVSRYLPDRLTRRSQTWRTFLANHIGNLAFASTQISSFAPSEDDVDALVLPLSATPPSENSPRPAVSDCDTSTRARLAMEGTSRARRARQGWRTGRPRRRARRIRAGRRACFACRCRLRCPAPRRSRGGNSPTSRPRSGRTGLPRDIATRRSRSSGSRRTSPTGPPHSRRPTWRITSTSPISDASITTIRTSLAACARSGRFDSMIRAVKPCLRAPPARRRAHPRDAIPCGTGRRLDRVAHRRPRRSLRVTRVRTFNHLHHEYRLEPRAA
jgi:hypothetical protein